MSGKRHDEGQRGEEPLEEDPMLQAFGDGLLEAARQECPPEGLERRVIEATSRRSRGRVRALALGAAGATVLAAGVLFAVFGTGRSSGTLGGPVAVVAEPRDASQPAFRGGDIPIKELPLVPCEVPAVAKGTHPLLDDFEHEGAESVVAEGRAGFWEYITDLTGGEKSDYRLLPSLLPEEEASQENLRALYVREGLLRDWGASVEYDFLPSYCYDASAYAGIRFRAKGPVRVRVGARMPEVVPVEHGGLCEENCYNTHKVVLQLTDAWQTFEVPWEKFMSRGYDAEPLDPTRLGGLQFHVESEDTPFELWIDDVEFIEREPVR